MAEESISPISAPKPPAVNPLGTASHAATLKLKPVIRKPSADGARKISLPRPPVAVAAPAPAPAAPAPEPAAAPSAAPMDILKGVTQKLKGVTQQIPQQAILHKTGIIADQDLTEAQKQASKSRTARISLSDAIGVAPVQNESAPMKTIRIKRPVDVKPQPSGGAAAIEATLPGGQTVGAATEEPATTATQRKTLKISRPGAAVRPTGKFGVKKPGAESAATPAADGEVGDIPEIADIPAAPAAPVAARSSDDGIEDVASGLLVFDLILQTAACCAMGFLAWLLYADLGTAWF